MKGDLVIDAMYIVRVGGWVNWVQRIQPSEELFFENLSCGFIFSVREEHRSAAWEIMICSQYSFVMWTVLPIVLSFIYATVWIVLLLHWLSSYSI